MRDSALGASHHRILVALSVGRYIRQLLRDSDRGVRALRYKKKTTNRLFLRHSQLQSTPKRNERVPDNAYGRRSGAAIMNTDVTESLANRWGVF